MKRPCQALAGRRVVDHLMSVFRGCFCARSACPVGAENPVTLCHLGILADQAAEPLPAEKPDVCARSGWMRTPGRRALLQCPVRPVRIVVFSDRPRWRPPRPASLLLAA
jgi:hypothetical protein